MVCSTESIREDSLESMLTIEVCTTLISSRSNLKLGSMAPSSLRNLVKWSWEISWGSSVAMLTAPPPITPTSALTYRISTAVTGVKPEINLPTGITVPDQDGGEEDRGNPRNRWL
ncbi:unnamed protein product [Miscanthus lutarioriparius]|uniref:Uncharacterized protein n=1 Tax=Miscanthus lutarioriparius TaxID=422564 RepID=A0A811QXL4_9POAL|nr:unnamed protein product [Miscanthus lutarioriparius]